MEDTRQAPHTAPRTFDFTGDGFEYFRIWIVNLALTIVTLGIFSAWAKVRRLRYFYGHTQLDGHAFSYLADPVKILKGRILAVGLLVAYSLGTTLLPNLALYIVIAAVLLVPFIIVTSSAFAMRNSAYRNVRFGFGGTAGEAYRVLLPPLGFLLLLVAAMYFATDPEGFYDEETGEWTSRAELLPSYVFLAVLPLLPWLDCLRMRFVIANTRFGNRHASFGAGVWDFYKLYLGAFAMFLVAGLVLFFVGGLMFGLASASADAAPSVASVLILALSFYALLFTVGAWFAAHRANLLRNSTRFGASQLEGALEAFGLVKLYLGNLILIVLTCGLFIPFAAVRLHRYNAAHTAADTTGLDHVVAVAEQERSAIGEEIGEFFDVDIGI